MFVGVLCIIYVLFDILSFPTCANQIVNEQVDGTRCKSQHGITHINLN